MKHSKIWMIGIPLLLLVILLAIPVFVILGKMGFFRSPPTAQVNMTASKDAPELVFVADYDYDPYSYLNEDGTPNGMDVEIAYELANRLGMRPRIEFGTWTECKTKIRDGNADVLLGLEIFVDGTSTGTLKSIPIGADTLSIIGKTAVDDAAALSGKKVGISSGSVLINLFKLNCEYVGYFTYSDMLAALDHGDVDFAICHTSVAMRLIEKNGYHCAPSLVLMESFPTMGIRQDKPELLEKINRALEEMSVDGTISSLRDKWIVANVMNRSLSEVFHNYEEFFILYAILAIVLLFGYVIAILAVRASLVRKKALETEQEQQKKLEEALELAKGASRAKTEFLFNMSHDIRTPMNAITGFTDKAIRHKDEPPVLEDSLGKVKTACDYMLKIINDILDMAKIESGKLELKNRINYIEDGNKAVLELFGAEASKKGLEFLPSFSIRDHYLWFDGDRMLQVIANLLSNAIKYTEPGGEIRYSVTQMPNPKEGFGTFVIRVQDTGQGMSPEFLERIFDAFERERSAISSDIQGTGLGMSIVKRLIDAMGATIDIQSEQGKGTTVTVTAEHRIATVAEIEDYNYQKESELDLSLVSFAGKHVLLVEDNERNREVATDILETEGLVVEDAANGAAAVQIVKEKGPQYYDFILMDIQMPVMNGYEATRAIRNLYPDADLPIIALSANAFAEDIAASKEAGMNDHVAKPIIVHELFRVLAKYL